MLSAGVLLACVLMLAGPVKDALAIAPPYQSPPLTTSMLDNLKTPDTIPSSMSNVPGLTYPAAWDAASTVEVRAGMAARALPLLSTLGTIGLAAGALDIGWHIGSAVYLHLLTPAGPAQVGPWSWDYTTGSAATTYCPGAVACWMLTGQSLHFATRTRFEQPGVNFDGDVTPTTTRQEINDLRDGAASAGAAAGASMFLAPNGRTVAGEYGSGSTSSSVVVLYPRTSDQLTSSFGARPMTSSAYTALPTAQKFTSAYTPPSLTSTDGDNARAVFGAPVAGGTPGHFHDASGNPLSDAQVVAQTDENCRLDPSYCAGGTNDPTAPGGPAAGTITAPDCAGLLYSACAAAFAAAGFTATPTRTTLSFSGADVTKPADAVVSTTPAPSTLTAPSTSITITANPSPASMPLVLPAPLAHETYSDYLARLQALGLLSTSALRVDLTDATLDPDRAANEAVRTDPAAGTRVLPGGTVDIFTNPPTAPDPGGGGFSGPTIPAIDLGPLQHAIGCDKFPFGIPCWTYGVVSSWVTGPSAPTFCMPFPFVHPDPCIDMGIWDDAMPLVRATLLLMTFIGLGWLFMRAALGFGGGGGDED